MGSKLLLSVLCLVWVLAINADQLRRYHGYTVYRLLPTTKSQLKYLHDLTEAETDLINFWTYPKSLNEPVDIMVAPNYQREFASELKAREISQTTLIQDAEEAFEKQRQPAEVPISPFMDDDTTRYFTAYRRLADIFTLLGTLNTNNPSITQIENIGSSTNGRNLRIIKIGVNVAANTKPILFLDGGIHAREWISPATVTYIAQRLIDGYNSNDATVRPLLTAFDWYILPVLNPDGYEYTHTNERLWRKTRSANSGSTCIGTDPNRNFDYQWNTVGASTNPCSEIYAGSRAFSEPETRLLSDYIYARRSRIRGYFNVHSYGQYWLYPWGYTSALPPHDAQLRAAANAAVTALTAHYNTRYTIGTSTNVLYAAAGGADDWAYGNASVTYSYCVELRDTGSNGFTLPAAQIIPTGNETFSAFRAIANHIGALYGDL